MPRLARSASFVFLFVSFAIPSVHAARPADVHLIRNGPKMSNDWYAEQAELWRQEVAANPENAAGWRNYYLASHYTDHGQANSAEKQEGLSRIHDEMSTAVPDSWQYLYITLRERAWALNTEELRQMLERAIKYFFSDHSCCGDLFVELAGEFEVSDDPGMTRPAWAMAYQTDVLASGLIEYNYNLLMSTAENAILFTNGDNDTYPAWMLQRLKKIRPDVLVLNRWLIRKFPSYAKRRLGEKGIELDANVPAAAGAQFLPSLCKTIAAQDPDIPIYIALTVPGDLKESINDRLYVTGLASRYSENRIDNLALLKRNVGRRFRLDHLSYDWNSDQNSISLPGVYRLNTNYAVPFLMLFEHYTAGGELEEAARWEKLSHEVALKSERGDEIRERMTD